jgi:hypothetical protein
MFLILVLNSVYYSHLAGETKYASILVGGIKKATISIFTPPLTPPARGGVRL